MSTFSGRLPARPMMMAVSCGGLCRSRRGAVDIDLDRVMSRILPLARRFIHELFGSFHGADREEEGQHRF